jgi:hypothetical protein
MDTLSDMLNHETGIEYHPAILQAMSLAKKKINHYYSLTDSSAPYRIAMGKQVYKATARNLLMQSLLVLHPGLKLEYFCCHDWEEEWIGQAENMVHKEYIATYENKSKSAQDAVNVNTPNAKVCCTHMHMTSTHNN